MVNLSKKAKKKKLTYNVKRNRELTKTFSTRLPKEEYQEMCDYLKSIEMNKADFIRWAYSELRK
jgi:hypothetical protein